VIVVATPGVSGDTTFSGGRKLWKRPTIRPSEHDDAADAVENVSRVLIGRAARGQIIHFTGVATGKPFGKMSHARRRDSGASSNEQETELFGLGLDELCKPDVVG